jgi:hypothetical protein
VTSFTREASGLQREAGRRPALLDKGKPEVFMTQSPYAFKVEEEVGLQVTGMAGLPLIYEVFHKMKLPELIQKQVSVKKEGWSDTALIETIVGLVCAGGEHMEDVSLLQSDEALLRLLEKEGEESDRKNRQKELPSPKALERFLKGFHRDFTRPEGILAFVPEETKELKGLGQVLQSIARKMIRKASLKSVTIENDATPVFSQKRGALGTYKGGVGYMPVTATIAELGITIADEFRDGNVPPAFEVTKFFKEGLKAIPQGVKVNARLDGAYYDHDLIAFFNDADKEWGIIEFTITAKKTPSLLEWIEALPQKVWKPLMKMSEKGPEPTGREWAELDWTSAEGSQAEIKARSMRYLVTRKVQAQWEMFQKEFKADVKEKDRYEAICTNKDWAGDRLIRWHYERGGAIEHTHDRIKNDLAGGVLPCGEFGANAAWWRLQCLAWNIVRALQLYALTDELKSCHMKKLRLKLLCIAGKVVRHARSLILKLTGGHPAFGIYEEARRKIGCLAFP